MHEILRSLPVTARALDLGCAHGSFPRSATRAYVVRVDRDLPGSRGDGSQFVQADSSRLPFAKAAFEAVISNHSLEHFEDLQGALLEIRRIVASGGALYVAVPDVSTLTDKLYRWLAGGGGHVNAFRSPRETAALIERTTGLPHVATRVLCSSLSFLNRRNAPRPLPKRLYLLGAGYEWSLFLYSWMSRCLDRWFGTRTSVYGWAFYFGNVTGPVDTGAWVNVCVRCGSASAASSLLGRELVRGVMPGLRVFHCPDCGARNPFSDDFAADG